MASKKHTIVHIAPHLGGGVGTVMLNYLVKNKGNNGYEHSIYCLDSINENAKRILTKYSICSKELVSHTPEILLEAIASADIIVVHWWNHPLLFEFLVKNELPPCRIAFWSHVSGTEAPHIFSHTLFDYPDYFIFTTPMSYLVNEVTTYKKNHSVFRAIWSTGGLDHIKHIERKEHKGFNVGYIGTVDYSKMHPHFLKICSQVDIPDANYIVCGGGHIEQLQEEVAQYGLEDKFKFTGFVEDISPYLEIFDVFAYPLTRNHYGTCDQALAEAMGCGIVPIVLNNNMENYMVHNMYSGIVATDEEEFSSAIIEMYQNKGFRDRLSLKAKEEAFRRFSIEETIKEWDYVYFKLLDRNKAVRNWSGKYSGMNVEPYQIFFESLGDYAQIFENGDETKIQQLANKSLSWKSKSKGTAHQYAAFFQEDLVLQKISDLMK